MRLGKALAVGVVEETTAKLTRAEEQRTRPGASTGQPEDVLPDVHARQHSDPSERPTAPERGEPVAAPPSR